MLNIRPKTIWHLDCIFDHQPRISLQWTTCSLRTLPMSKQFFNVAAKISVLFCYGGQMTVKQKKLLCFASLWKSLLVNCIFFCDFQQILANVFAWEKHTNGYKKIPQKSCGWNNKVWRMVLAKITFIICHSKDTGSYEAKMFCSTECASSNQLETNFDQAFKCETDWIRNKPEAWKNLLSSQNSKKN